MCGNRGAAGSGRVGTILGSHAETGTRLRGREGRAIGGRSLCPKRFHRNPRRLRWPQWRVLCPTPRPVLAACSEFYRGACQNSGFSSVWVGTRSRVLVITLTPTPSTSHLPCGSIWPVAEGRKDQAVRAIATDASQAPGGGCAEVGRGSGDYPPLDCAIGRKEAPNGGSAGA
jgi:hypothetical protein